MSKKKGADKDSAKNMEQETKSVIAADLPVNIHAQYIRDLSFENPSAPESLRGGGLPEMDISIGMDARELKLGDAKNSYEVVLNVRAEAKRKESTVFIAELQYGIALSIGEDVPQESHHPLLFIEIPRLAFPFARQIVSDLTMQGGYPPLMLNPVDFHALYLQRFSRDIEAAKASRQKSGS